MSGIEPESKSSRHRASIHASLCRRVSTAEGDTDPTAIYPQKVSVTPLGRRSHQSQI